MNGKRCKNAASWMETVKKGWWWRRNGWVGIHRAFGLELSPVVDAFFSRQKLLVPYCTIAEVPGFAFWEPERVCAVPGRRSRGSHVPGGQQPMAAWLGHALSSFPAATGN